MSISMSHRFDRSILREYDIRGIVGKTLSTDDAHQVGRAFGTMIRRKGGSTVCVGYDGRLSSPVLESALVKGLMSTGLKVWRVGRGPTPMLYFATRTFGADGGIMVTGSHNPPDHNGFKMMLGKGPVYGEQIQHLAALADAADLESGLGAVEDRPAVDQYVDRLHADYTGDKALTVAWDAGNGAAGEAVTALAAMLPGRHHLLYVDIDGGFPNHHPDPTVPENLVALQDAVRRHRCDVGIAFD